MSPSSFPNDGVSKNPSAVHGNKRTAIFAANALLLQENTGVMLTVPLGVVDGVELSERFSELLARAYLFGEDDGLKALLRDHGFVALG